MNNLSTAGQDYYLHIKGTDEGGVTGFLGDFEISGTDHTFSNGLTTLNTNSTDYVVSTTGWNNYQPKSNYGTNGVRPRRNVSRVERSAQWIWSSDNDADNDNDNYFSVRIVAQTTIPIAGYRFDALDWNGSPNEVLDKSLNNHHGVAAGMTTLGNRMK
ncbi:MAG: hypothetical protein ACJAVV_002781 [Alphaproteobacteria bacterium]|jgi:hypothetical protein